MIYLTADLHGEIERFKDKRLRRLKKGDTLIVLGDFGFLWNRTLPERRILSALGRAKYQILFLEGAHENFSLLNAVTPEPFCGGMSRPLGGKLRQLCRGGVFTIEGKRIFVCGGGQPDPVFFETNGADFLQPPPDDAELAAMRERLRAEGDAVDYILTHEAPESLHRALAPTDRRNETNALNRFFTEVAEGVRYGHWYFGCYHIDRRITPLATAVYTDIVPLC